MKILICSLVLIAAVLAREKYVPCDTNDDCTAGQCCVPEHKFWILSKRDDLEPVFELGGDNPKKGRCQDYIREGADCYQAGFASCGCEPGTKCEVHHSKPVLPELFPEKTIEVGKRDFMPFFGTSECKKAE